MCGFLFLFKSIVSFSKRYLYLIAHIHGIPLRNIDTACIEVLLNGYVSIWRNVHF